MRASILLRPIRLRHRALQPNWICPQFIAATLVARGFDTVEKAQEFLNPSLERDWANPYEIENMEAAVNRIEAAIKNEEHILVFGDFDLDGVSPPPS